MRGYYEVKKEDRLPVGGFVRGLTHIGILNVFEKNKIISAA